jgi:hypothetical protein
MGIRMALGANRADILRMVLRESARIAFIGAGVGIIAGLLVTRAIRGVLYGVSVYDPVSFAGSALALTFVALALAMCRLAAPPASTHGRAPVRIANPVSRLDSKPLLLIGIRKADGAIDQNTDKGKAILSVSWRERP